MISGLIEPAAYPAKSQRRKDEDYEQACIATQPRRISATGDGVRPESAKRTNPWGRRPIFRDEQLLSRTIDIHEERTRIRTKNELLAIGVVHGKRNARNGLLKIIGRRRNMIIAATRINRSSPLGTHYGQSSSFLRDRSIISWNWPRTSRSNWLTLRHRLQPRSGDSSTHERRLQHRRRRSASQAIPQ